MVGACFPGLVSQCRKHPGTKLSHPTDRWRVSLLASHSFPFLGHTFPSFPSSLHILPLQPCNIIKQGVLFCWEICVLCIY